MSVNAPEWVTYLKAQLELGASEVFFEEPLKLQGARPVIAPMSPPQPAPREAYSPQPTRETISSTSTPKVNAPTVAVASGDLSLFVPASEKKAVSPTEELSAIEGAKSLEAFHEAVMHHSYYRLGPGSPGRIAFGLGPVPPPLMLIGFSPSEEDLRTSAFFSGPASELLRKLLESLHHSRNLCYSTWFVKKPVASPPLPRQAAMLRKMLMAEVSLVKPELILILGENTFQAVMNRNVSLQSEGGAPMEFAGVRTTAIFDPAQMLENSNLKMLTWKQHLPKSGYFRQQGM